MNTFSDLLVALTVDCKDNGVNFVTGNRIEVIRRLLADSDYRLLMESPLAFIYGKPGSSCRILVSSHIDCVYPCCFVKQEIGGWQGTFDNSATNAALIGLMLQNRLPDDVWIAFTGDEEVHSRGAVETMQLLGGAGQSPERVIVLDVSNEGFADEAVCSVENDYGFDIMSGFQLVQALKNLELPCVVVHDAEPDESWDYRKGIKGMFPELPCISLCIPVSGELHGDDGVFMRESVVAGYQKVL